MKIKASKLISVILSLMLVIGSIPVTAFAATGGTCGDVSWQLNGDTLSISGNGEMANYTASTSPDWEEYSAQIKIITVAGGVTKIGNYAFFGLDNVTSVTLNEGLQTIGIYAFNYCSALTEIVIPSTLENIGNAAFGNSGISTITFRGTSLAAVGNNTFTTISNAKIIVPEGFTIGSTAAVPAKTGSAPFYNNYVGLSNGKATVYWESEGTVLETDTEVAAGTTPTYNGETPTKAATATATYTFSGWTPEVTAAAASEIYIYTASFEESEIVVSTYTVTWKNYDGTVLETDTDVEAGSTPEYNSSTPIKTADSSKHYVHSGWTPEISAVTDDIEYTAVFTESAHTYGEPEWNWADDYSTASAALTCSACQHKENVVATVTSEEQDSKTVYTATAEFNGQTYTDAQEVEKQKTAQDIYNLTVEENIDVNILVDVRRHTNDGEEIEKIEYSYPDISTESRNTLTETVLAQDITTDANGYYEKSFTMAIAQVNEPITAVIYFTNGTTKEIEVSVASYCKYIIDNAEEKGYDEKLVNLCYAALEYGKRAISYFGYEYPADITYPEYTLPEEFNAVPEITSQSKIIKGSVVTGIASTQMFILSNATMRLIFKDDISTLTVTSAKAGERDLTAEIVQATGNRWAVDISGIEATELNRPIILELSDGTSVQYAATDWSRSILKNSTNEASKALAKSLYYYSKAANDYFA